MEAAAKPASMIPIDIYTSYFYQVRFMTPQFVPVSTAVWDPKWFHAGKGQDYTFRDKNGVWNGLRTPWFRPDSSCDGLCRGPEGCAHKPQDCSFLQCYRAQLDRLDFDTTVKKLVAAAQYYQEKDKLPTLPAIVLLVHEAPTNPCSERWPLQSWFRDNGYEIKEFSKIPTI